MPEFNFIWLVDSFLEQNIHLDNLCVVDEVIKTDKSFHCTICNKCSDNYDHHCPFIDNCLGTRNHKYFLLFLSSYFTYSLSVIAAAVWRFYLLATDHINSWHEPDTYWSIILLLLIVLPMPVLIF